MSDVDFIINGEVLVVPEPKKRIIEMMDYSSHSPDMSVFSKDILMEANKEVMKEKRKIKPLYDTARAHGRSSYTFRCPFCGSHVEAFKRSLSASGKKCGCGALITYNCLKQYAEKDIKESK